MKLNYDQIDTFLELTEIILGNQEFKKRIKTEDKSILLFSISKSKREALAIFNPLMSELNELIKDASKRDEKDMPIFKNQVVGGKLITQYEIKDELIETLNKSSKDLKNKEHDISIEKLNKDISIVLSDYLDSKQTEFLLNYLTNI